MPQTARWVQSFAWSFTIVICSPDDFGMMTRIAMMTRTDCDDDENCHRQPIGSIGLRYSPSICAEACD